MGTLTFSDIEIRMLGQDFASVLGMQHARSKESRKVARRCDE
jgi:hypothetical protein